MRAAAPLLTMVALSSATPAWACTLCHSRVAGQVRAAVFGADFWNNVAAVLSPVPILCVAVFAMRRYLP